MDFLINDSVNSNQATMNVKERKTRNDAAE